MIKNSASIFAMSLYEPLRKVPCIKKTRKQEKEKKQQQQSCKIALPQHGLIYTWLIMVVWLILETILRCQSLATGTPT